MRLAPRLRPAREQVARRSAYQLLERVLDVNVSHADLSVRARAAAPALRRLLRLRAGVPLIALERVSCDAAAAPLEHTLYWANAESYEFVLGVRGQVPITPSIRGIR